MIDKTKKRGSTRVDVGRNNATIKEQDSSEEESFINPSEDFFNQKGKAMCYKTSAPPFPASLEEYLVKKSPPPPVAATLPFQFTQNGLPILPVEAGTQPHVD